MTHVRIADLNAGDEVNGCYIVREAREGTTRTGSRFLTLSVCDASATVTGRVWSPEDAWPAGLVAPAVCRLRGRVESYRDELQLNIERASAYEPRHDEYAELLPTSTWSPDVLYAELRAHVEGRVRALPLRRLLLAVLDDAGVSARFRVSPAAVANHHAYRAGLVEHTLSMMRIASLLATHYAAYYPGRIDEDVLIAGVLLHDMAKIWELEGDLAPGYSTPGRLVGHIPMGATFVQQVAERLGDIPVELVWELQHMVLSHHGELEFGAAQRPMTVEAQLLHYIDQIDAKANYFAREVSDDGWTGYLRIMQRALLNPTSLRDTWTTPPTGTRGERGPGAPADGVTVDGGDRTPAPAPAPPARATTTPADAAPPVPGVTASPKQHTPPPKEDPPPTPQDVPAPPDDDVPPPGDDDAPPWLAPDDLPDDPPVAPTPAADVGRTLSLFDGLD